MEELNTFPAEAKLSRAGLPREGGKLACRIVKLAAIASIESSAAAAAFAFVPRNGRVSRNLEQLLFYRAFCGVSRLRKVGIL